MPWTSSLCQMREASLELLDWLGKGAALWWHTVPHLVQMFAGAFGGMDSTQSAVLGFAPWEGAPSPVVVLG